MSLGHVIAMGLGLLGLSALMSGDKNRTDDKSKVVSPGLPSPRRKVSPNQPIQPRRNINVPGPARPFNPAVKPWR